MAVHLIAEISKARVRRNFDRAAASYAPEAGIQRTLAATLAAWEPPPEACPERPVLDLGAGTGFVSAAIRRARPHARIVAVDLSEGMLRAFENVPGVPRVAGDAEHLPFADGTFGEAVSGLSLQWIPDLVAALSEVRRVLVPGGTIRISAFVEGTLEEMQRALSRADADVPAHPLRTAAALRAAAEAAGLVVDRAATMRRMMRFERTRDLLAHLRRIGAGTAGISPGRVLLSHERLLAFEAAYRRISGGGPLPATFLAAFLRARK